MKSLLSKKNQENVDSLKLTINDIENYKLNFNTPSWFVFLRNSLNCWNFLTRTAFERRLQNDYLYW